MFQFELFDHLLHFGGKRRQSAAGVCDFVHARRLFLGGGGYALGFVGDGTRLAGYVVGVTGDFGDGALEPFDGFQDIFRGGADGLDLFDDALEVFSGSGDVFLALLYGVAAKFDGGDGRFCGLLDGADALADFLRRRAGFLGELSDL